MNQAIASVWEYLRGDKMIWLVVILLFIVSMLAVYSATGTLAYKMQVDNESYLVKQVVLSIAGLLLMFFVHLMDYRYYSRIAQLLWYVSIPLLVYTMFFGLYIHGARRLLMLPFVGLTFQPSDLAKLALLMYLARQLAILQAKDHTLKDVFLQIILPVSLTCILIVKDNLSTALIIYSTSFLIMFIGRVQLKHLGVLLGISLILAILFVTALHVIPENTLISLSERAVTWKHRMDDFAINFAGTRDRIGAGEDYQVEQAKIAIAKGGLLKLNPGGSDQRNFLPEAYNDFIYVIIIEEYGLMGGLIVLLLYLFFLYRCIRIAIKVSNAFGALLALGLGLALVLQALINMAVSVNLLPVTGVTLPLVSMGGSSVVFTSLALGTVLSVSRHVEEGEKTMGGQQENNRKNIAE